MREFWKTNLDANDLANQEGALGLKRETRDGRVFRYIKAGASDLTKGELVQPKYWMVPDLNEVVDANQAVGTDTLTGTGDFAGKTYNLGEGWFVYIDGDTVANGLGQMREIDHVINDNTIKVVGAWTTALVGASSTYVIFNPWIVEQNAADGLNPVGVVQNNITANYYGWMQTYGPAVVDCDIDPDPLVVGEKAMSGETAGECSGFTAAGTTVGDLAVMIGNALIVPAADGLAVIFLRLE